MIAQMAGKIPNKSNDEKIKNNDINHHNSNGGRISTRQGNTSRGGHRGRGRGRGGRGGRGNNSEHLKNVECFNCGKKGHYPTDCSLPRKNDNEQSNMVSKSDFKNLFKSSMKEMLTKQDKQTKKSTEGNDDSLEMNVFEKLMEGTHTMIVTKSNDDLISINDTDTFDYSMQDKITHKNCEHNNYNDDYDELAYPFSKRIKLKHEPEKAQVNVPVQYTADIIVEIKNRDGTVVPMRSLLDTGTTATIILTECVG
jgi:ribosomal protein L15